MSLQTGIAQLHEAMRDLRRAADRAKMYWTDAVQEEFEKHYLQPLELIVQRSLEEMQRLDEALRQMQRDCT